ncbi:MAG: type II toxin-antitoxin system VapC family toxin [Candidatus Asgardarchaeia archaeon]
MELRGRKKKRYVDVNVFVYWLSAHPKFGITAKKWIHAISESTPGMFLTSAISIYETTVVLAGLTNRTLKDTQLIDTILSAFSKLNGLEIIPISKETLFEAYNIMKELSLDFEDAIHLSVAIKEKADEIVSNDKDFDNSPIPRVF